MLIPPHVEERAFINGEPLILDNLSAHKTKLVAAFLDEHPNVAVPLFSADNSRQAFGSVFPNNVNHSSSIVSRCLKCPFGTSLRCLKRDVGFSRPISDWGEIQANMGMSALLMPKPVFCAAFDQSRTLLGVSGRAIIADSAIYVELVALLARRFTVWVANS